jgi:hypothetical protein
MHFWTLDRLGTKTGSVRPPRSTVESAEEPHPVALLFGCRADCFAPALLDRQLAPGMHWVHHTTGTFVSPCGAGHALEDDLIEQAVTAWKVQEIIVCGHWPCGILAQLLQSDAPAEEVVGADCLVHAAILRNATSRFSSAICTRTLRSPWRCSAVNSSFAPGCTMTARANCSSRRPSTVVLIGGSRSIPITTADCAPSRCTRAGRQRRRR